MSRKQTHQWRAKCRCLALILFIAFFSALPRLAAQDAPRLVFNTNQPRDVAFLFDSSRLYSSGQEKFVHAWEILKRGSRIPRYNIVEADQLRWDLARGPRGMVYTMAASPTEPLLAIAGYGARTPNGDIAIFDTTTGQIVQLLPQARSQPNQPATGHRQNVYSLSFSQDGNKLASISLDGEMRIWTRRGGQWSTRSVIPAARQMQAIVKVAFLDQNNASHDVAASIRSGNAARIRLIDSRGGSNPVDLSQVHENYVTAIAQDPKSAAWASADGASNVYLWQGGGPQQPVQFQLADNGVAVDLAFGPQGRIFVATKGNPANNQPATFEMWDLSTRQRLDQVITSPFRANFACAVSPDQEYAVTCGDGDHALIVFPLRSGDGRTLLDRPLSRGTRVVTADPGRSVGKVAFEAKSGSYRLGFGPIRRAASADFNNYGDVVQAFDFTEARLLRESDLPEDTRWRGPDDNARGAWRLRFSDATRRHIDLLFQGQPVCNIDMDQIMNREGSVTSYCWLAGPEMTYAIALGTNLQNGVYVFQLTNNGRPCPLLRYFRDHTGTVNSISVSHDGNYLASGSSDQTIKVWSLEGIRSWNEVVATRQPFSRASAWGAVFQQRNNAVEITRLVDGGIAANRGLQQGDRVMGIFNNAATTPAQILKVLEETKDWNQLHLRIRRAGQPDFWSRAIVPAWEPIMTLLVDKKERWALATPQGPYNASPDGDELFGWHVNGGRQDTPEFHRSDFLRKDFEKPDVMKRLLAVGDLRKALREALPADRFQEVDRGIRRGSLVADATKERPVIRITNPVEGELYENPRRQPTISVQAQVLFKDQRIQDSYTLTAYLNGVPGEQVGNPQPPEADGQRWRYRFQWQIDADAIHQYNSTVVMAEGIPSNPRTDGLLAADSVVFQSTQRPVPSRLHMLAITADTDYPAAFRLFESTKDATKLRKALHKHGTEVGAPALFEPGSTRIHLKNGEITRQRVEQAVQKLKTVIEGSQNHAADLLVVFISGHGIAVDKNDFYFVPPHPELTNFTNMTEQEIQQDPGKRAIIRRIGVGWESLGGLATIKCRKWVILDTCFSGAAATSRPAEHEKAKLRPLVQQQMLVMSTTGEGQIANEGVAMKQMLKGIAGAADGRGFVATGAQVRAQKREFEKDGVIDFWEFFHYVHAETDRLTKVESGRRQTPQVSPESGLQNFFAVPIGRYERQAAGG